MNVFEIVFSPTGRTEKVSDELAKVFDPNIQKIDLTAPDTDFSSVEISKENICVIAVPSYGGRVPATAVSRLKKLNGNQAKAILVAVYGNREIDDTLVELNDTAVSAGFVPIAAVSAVAEHSIVRKFAAGRPDSEDVSVLKAFAEKILFAAQGGKIGSLELPGNRPYKEYKGAAAKPVVDSSCSGCGFCAEKCPVGAIPKDSPAQTNTEICISCMRCISICPNHSRQIDVSIIDAIAQKLESVCSKRKSNKLYL